MPLTDDPYAEQKHILLTGYTVNALRTGYIDAA